MQKQSVCRADADQVPVLPRAACLQFASDGEQLLPHSDADGRQGQLVERGLVPGPAHGQGHRDSYGVGERL